MAMIFKSCWLMSSYTFNMFKNWSAIYQYKMYKNEYIRDRRLKG